VEARPLHFSLQSFSYGTFFPFNSKLPFEVFVHFFLSAPFRFLHFPLPMELIQTIQKIPHFQFEFEADFRLGSVRFSGLLEDREPGNSQANK